MIFLLFGSIVLEATKICICNKKCSPLCSSLSYSATSTNALQTFINSNLQSQRELELNFYSNTEDNIFDIDLSHFSDKTIQLKALLDSKTINIALKKDESQIEKITIEPNQQIPLSQFDMPRNKNYNIKATPDHSIMSNPDGLINVTCNNFNHVGTWGIGINGDADHGSYTKTPGSTASYTFNGTKVHILAYMESGSGYGNIYIDSKKVTRVSFNSNNQPGIPFSSDELPFGEHTIKVEHDGNSAQSIVLISFLYDPLPKHDRQKFGFEQMEKTSGNWVQSNENSHIFSSSEKGSIGTFKFHGTRFWLTGVQDGTHGKFTLKIDDDITENIDILITNKDLVTRLPNHNPSLLYQSDVLDLRDHVVQIIVDDNEVSLVNFMCTKRPFNAVYCPYNEMSKKGAWREESGGFLSRGKGASLSVYGYYNHFWIVGNSSRNEASMDVYYNDEKKDSIETSGIKSSYTDIVLLHESNNSVLDTYNFKIENNGDGVGNNNQKYLHISYLYYLNDKTITIKEEYETIDISKIEHDKTWSEEVKTNQITNLYCKTKGSSISTQFSGDKFWIRGSLGPNYGNIEIIIDGEKLSSVSLYHEREENDIVYYESPSLSFRYHTLTLSNPSSNGVNFYKIHYQHTPDDQSMIDNLSGLINITCDKFEYGANDNWHKCITGGSANKGSYSKKPGAKAWYTFNGTRVHVLAIREPNSGRINIRLDGKLVANANLNIPKDRAEIVYSSDELPFGEHLIEVENNVSVDTAIVLRSFLIDPLPRQGGYKLEYKDHISKTGDWELNETGTPTFSSTSPDASITFKFHGTRFWLTGERGLTIGKVSLSIDEGPPIVIDECIYEGTEYKDSSNGNKAVLYYQSEVYELKDHTVKIIRNEHNISLVNILYSTQPYNGIVVNSSEMIATGDWETSSNGLISSTKGSKLSLREFFNEIWIIGNKELTKSYMSISLNNNKITTINTNDKKTLFGNEVLLYKTDDLPYDTYELDIINEGSKDSPTEELPLHISYLYYLNSDIIEVDQNSIKIDSTEIINRTGKWIDVKLTGNINNLYTETKDSSITIEFTGNRFWLVGSVGPNYGCIDIFIDDKKTNRVSLYKEKNEDNVVYFESSPFPHDEHKLTILNVENKPISIYCLFYDIVAPTFEFTASKTFSSSEAFSKSAVFSSSGAFSSSGSFSSSATFSPSATFSSSAKFSSTVGFSRSNDFSPSLPFIDPEEMQPSCFISDKGGNRTLTGKRCDYDSTNDPSTIVQIARSNFTNITYDKNGGAIYIINSGFDCEKVEFRNCSSISGGGGAIYIKNSVEQENNVILNNLVFIECHAVYGGAVFIYFDSEKNSISIKSCKFNANYASTSNPESDILFGGGSIFLSCMKSFILRCKFTNGGSSHSVKLCDISSLKGNSYLFLQKQNRIKENDNENLILFSDCSFEIDKESKGSINVDFANKENRMKMEVTGCEFKGKLAKGSHYIDGKLASNDEKRFEINSCKFEDESELNVKFDIIEDQLHFIRKNSFTSTQIFIFAASLTASAIFTILRLIKSRLRLRNQIEDLFNEEN